MSTLVQYNGIGRRKTASARVYLRPGTGRVVVNGRELDNYIPRASQRMDLMQPLDITETKETLDVFVTVRGGGMSGQTGAIRLGVARALLKVNPAYRPALKAAGMLTRDARKVERKKYGQPGARAHFQFSKR
jgi:small subunit ribosomal protein S9